MNQPNQFCLSIVSHGQGKLIQLLLNDLATLQEQNFEVIITLNIPEDETPYQDYKIPIRIIRNVKPKGFGANHNHAFYRSLSKWFVVVNPDIRLQTIVLKALISPFQNPAVAAVAPIVLSCKGEIEDSARRFPTLKRLIKRKFSGQKNADYEIGEIPVAVDWVAGMFVVFRGKAYLELEGFDDRRFFMYLEDADICRRIASRGWQVVVNPNSTVIHTAQRASRRNLRHMRWHVVSAFRYLTGL